MALSLSLKNPFAETPTPDAGAVAMDPLARQTPQPEDAVPPRAIVVMEEPAPRAIVVDEEALEGNISTEMPEGTPAISPDPVKDGIPQSAEPPKPDGLLPKGVTGGVGEKEDLIRDGTREAKYQRELKEIEDMARNPEKAYRGVDFNHAPTRGQGMTNTTVERYLMLRTDGPLPPDLEEREQLRKRIAREEFGGLGGESNEAFLTQIKLRAEKREHHEALYGDAIHHAQAHVLLDTAERNQGKENRYTWESFLETAKKHPGYTEGDDIRLRETWIAAKNELEKRVGPFTFSLRLLWKHYSEEDREKALGSLLERGGMFQNMAEKTAEGPAKPNAIQDFAQFMQDAGYFNSLTASLSGAWDKNIWKEKTGNWNFPHLHMHTDSALDSIYGVGNVIDHKINRRMIVEGELGRFMAGFQNKWGLDDKDMKTLWSDLGNMYRKWEDEEKFRTLSNGMIMPNMMHTDWLDTDKAIKMIETSGASPEIQAVTLRNLHDIQQQIVQSKRDAYEMASAATNTAFSIARLIPSPARTFANGAGNFISPSDWAKQQGRYDEINDPQLLLDYEQAVIHSSPKLSKLAWGLTADLTQGYIKIYTSLAGAAGAMGWDKAGESAADWHDIATQIGQGQYDTGFAGKVIEELPMLAVQIAITRGAGIGVGMAARGLGATAATAATWGARAANFSAPLVAAGQSVGSTISAELAAGATMEEARAKAMKAGIATALITSAFQLAGAGGVEKIAAGKPADATLGHLLAGGSREQITKNLRKFAKDTLKQAGAEATEEALDGLISSFLTADPDTNLANAWGDSMQGAVLGGTLGVGAHTASSVLENSPDAKSAARQLGATMEGAAPRAREVATSVYDLYQKTPPEQRGALMDTLGQSIRQLPEAEQAAIYQEMETRSSTAQPPPLPGAPEQTATAPEATGAQDSSTPQSAIPTPQSPTAATETAPAVSPAPQAQGNAAAGNDASVRKGESVRNDAEQAPAAQAPAATPVEAAPGSSNPPSAVPNPQSPSQDFAADLARIRRGEYRSGPAVPPLSGDNAATAPGKARPAEDTSPAGAIPPAVTAAIEADTHQSLREEATRRGLPAVEASRIAGKAAPLIAAVRAVADRIGSALTTALPATAKALASLPDTLRAAALNSSSTARTASSPTRSALTAALSRDVPAARLTHGSRGVLDGAWVEHPSSLPHVLPLALSAVATRLPGKQRAEAFRNAPDHHLLALGISPADLSNIRKARNTFAATQAIEQAVTRLNPQSETALAATRQLIAEDTRRRGETQAAQGSGRQPRVIGAEGGGFRVLHPTTGKEIGFAKNARDAARLADSFTAQQTGTGNSDPSNNPSENQSSDSSPQPDQGNGGDNGGKPPRKTSGSDSPSPGDDDSSDANNDDDGKKSFAPSPPGNPFRDADGKLAIESHPDSSKDPDLAEKENEFIETLNRPIAEVDADYNAIADEHESSHGGKVISTDLPRKLLKAFAESKAGRILYTGITTAGARAYGRDRLWREIHNRGSRKKLMFTAGGIAAGKSSVVTDEVIAAQDLVYDATLRETKWAIQNIEKAIEQGWELQIVYVQRPIDLALKGAIDRANKQGRSFPLADLPAAHQDAQRSILDIAKHFKGNASVQIDLWLNSGTNREAPTPLEISQIDKGGKYSYEQHHDSRGTQSLARSNSESSDQRIPKSSTGRGAVLEAFREAVQRKDLSTELLSRLAGKDKGLLGILRKARPDFVAAPAPKGNAKRSKENPKTRKAAKRKKIHDDHHRPIPPDRTKKWSREFYEEAARQATVNPDSDTVVLGKYRHPDGRVYTKVAGQRGATYFKVRNWNEVTGGMDYDQMFEINKAFLRQQYLLGKEFVFSHDPGEATGFLLDEVNYLKRLGYKFPAEKTGWVWKVEHKDK